MEIQTLLWRNMKWRYSNAFTIVLTIIQPLLWLVLYSMVATSTMKDIGINNYTNFIIPGLFILVAFGTCSSSGIMNYLFKREGSFYRILIAPVSRVSIVMAQILEACLCTLLEAAIMFVAGIILGGKINCDVIGILLIILMLVLVAFFMAGITYSISLYLPNEMIFETVMNAIVLPLFFVSSALFPVENISGGIKIAINMNPFTHSINVIRDTMNGHLNGNNVIYTVLLFIILDVFSFMLAYYSLKKETKL